ncbi:L-rhamnose mutarotase [Haloarculaceae archaeon H-GB2-1]|nr:L-rhamnose mutarotase [Haloarculaceae archaeon H-GB1-1]MEA5409442.1 L-rhamnose mutarotase [Haloarculaceae archaeon H-GB2-1]
MARVALHFEIRDGMRDAYLEAHENVPAEIADAYRNSGAGVVKESVFEDDGHVFAYFEVDDPDRLLEFLTESEVIADWNDRMADYLEDEDLRIYDADSPSDVESPYMTEIYRID